MGAGAAVQRIDYLALAPVLAVTATAFAVLLADLLPLRPGPRRVLPPALTLGGLLAAQGFLLPLVGHSRATFCVSGGPPTPPACSYEVSELTVVFQLVALAGAAVVVLLGVDEVNATRLPAGEYHFLLLCSVAGAVTLAAARDLLTLLVALEVVSLPAFALVGLRRSDGASSEAAVKFFLVSVVSSAVTLYGISLLYGASGAVHLGRLAGALEALRAGGGADPRSGVAAVGVGLTLVGFAFKVSAVPFHFWAPDTYTGAPLPVAAYLSVVSKAAGLVGMVLVVGLGLRPYAAVWGPIMVVLAAVTMSVGNLVALRQRQTVRLLAWSSVAQAGYLLVPVAVAAGYAGDAAGHGGDLVGMGTALAATVAYLLVYAVVNLGAFAVVTALGRPGLGDYRGLVRREPVLAVCLLFFLLCLAGLPPGLVGLFAKVVVLQAAVDGGAGVLALVMAVNVVIALYYYLRWGTSLFARGDPPDVPARRVALGARLAVGITAAAAVALSIAPQWVLRVLGDGAALLR